MKWEVISLCFLVCWILISSEQIIEDCEFDSEEIRITPTLLLHDNFTEVSNGIMKFRIEWRQLKVLDKNSDDTYWIGVWNKSPNQSLIDPLKTVPVYQSNGFSFVEIEIRDKIQNSLSKRNLSEIPNCLPIYIALVQNENNIKISSCWEIHPVWMEQLYDQFYWKTLSNLFLPGISHNGLINSLPFCYDNFPWCELVMGSRYFQLFVAVDQESDNKYYSEFFGKKLSLIKFLNEIQTFVRETKEIIVIEIVLLHKRFYKGLEDIILTLLHDLLITKGLEKYSNIRDLISNNRRILITCPQIEQSQYIHKDLKNIQFRENFSKENVSTELKRNDMWTLNVEDANEITFSLRLKNELWRFLNIVTVQCIPCTDIVKLAKDINIRKNNCPEFRKSMRLLRTVAEKQPKNKKNFGGTEFCGKSNKIKSGIEIWPTIQAKPNYVKDKLKYRLIQINWKTNGINNDDLVAIFQELPCEDCVASIPETLVNETSTISTVHHEITSKDVMPLYAVKPDTPEGVITTTISHRRPTVSELGKGGCIGYWVAFLRQRKVVSSKCISSHPKWIWDNRSVIGNIPLPSLIIPGTHNSGSYLLENSVDPVNMWIVCQDESILNQLLLGTRYLDLRIGYYPDTRELLWVNHDMIRWISLQEVLEDIKAFAYMSPDPVIIDVHRTPVGFDKEEAAWLLVSLFNSTLGEYLAPYSIGFNVSSEDLWKTGKTLILSYGTPLMRGKISWLWPPIFQAWADAQNLNDLKRYLDEEMNENRNGEIIWAAMGHLTASMWDILFKSGDGIRGWADKTNKPLTNWLSESWRQKANIIATDFILSSDIIDTSIRLSIQKGLCEKVKEETQKNTTQSES